MKTHEGDRLFEQIDAGAQTATADYWHHMTREGPCLTQPKLGEILLLRTRNLENVINIVPM